MFVMNIQYCILQFEGWEIIKKTSQICDRCARRPVCADYSDNQKLALDGLSIAILECDIYLNPETATKDQIVPITSREASLA